MQKQSKSEFNVFFPAVMALLLAGLTVITGCSVSVNEDKAKGKEKVDISTPLGGLKVRTEVDPKETGLAVYPNARLAPKRSGDHDSNEANVNISTPFFGLKVVALDYETDDPPEKVIEFYKKDMARYGRVVECKGSGHNNTGNAENGKLTLDCERASGNEKNIDLKAGEGSSQHLVSIDHKDKGTEFGLVFIQIRGKAETM